MGLEPKSRGVVAGVGAASLAFPEALLWCTSVGGGGGGHTDLVLRALCVCACLWVCGCYGFGFCSAVVFVFCMVFVWCACSLAKTRGPNLLSHHTQRARVTRRARMRVTEWCVHVSHRAQCKHSNFALQEAPELVDATHCHWYHTTHNEQNWCHGANESLHYCATRIGLLCLLVEQLGL